MSKQTSWNLVKLEQINILKEEPLGKVKNYNFLGYLFCENYSNKKTRKHKRQQ